MVQPKFAIDIHADAADFLTAPINIVNAGNNSVIIGTDSKLIRVYMIWFLVSGATTVMFQDGTTTPFSGPASFTANEALVFDFCTKPWFVTSRGNDFVMNLGTAVQVGGMVYYTQDN